ncbi:MAG: ArnT family glycosyltransferase [Thermoanaerobaculia bacterium]
MHSAEQGSESEVRRHASSPPSLNSQFSVLNSRYALLVLALTALKVALAIVLPVSGDEAEYWDCSRHLDWSYLDHTPLLFWSMIPFRALFGETSLAIRLPSILSGLVIALALPEFVRRLGGPANGAERAWLALNAMPIFFIGSFYAWTDSPMLAAFVVATLGAVVVARGEARGWWIFGAAIGIGFLAKITVVLVLAAIVPLFFIARARATLRTRHPWLAALLAFALTAPFWIWGAKHDWANITFQLEERHTRGGGLDPLGAAEFLGTNMLLATPFLFVAGLVALWLLWKQSEAARPLVLAAVAPLVIFTLVALNSRPGAHWAAPLLLLGAIATGIVDFRARRALVVASAVLCAVVTIAVSAIALAPERLLGMEWSYARSPVRISPKYLVFAIGNAEIAAEAQRRLAPGEMMASENYTHVHLLSFLTGGEMPTRLAWMKKNAVSGLPSLYWYRPDELRGSNFLFVTEKSGFDAELGEIFESVTEEAAIEIRRGGEVVRSVRVLRCRNLFEPRGTFTLLED